MNRLRAGHHVGMTYPPTTRSRSPRSRKTSLALRLASLGAAVAALWPTAAEAADVGAGIGPYVSFVFGDTIGVGWGVETVVLVSNDNPCSDGLGDGNWGIGPTIKLGAVNLDTFQLVGGVAGGGSLTGDEEGPALVGEVGFVGSRHDKKWSPGLHTGVGVHSPYFVHGFFRQEWFVQQYSVGVGGLFPQIINKSATCEVGRVLRDASGTSVGRCAPWRSSARATRATRCADPTWMARAWSDDMQGEAASVPAFLQLAADLLAHEAPDDLVEAALDAAEDEIRHARLCARQASRFDGSPVAPRLPGWSGRSSLPGGPGLRRLAVESWVDGCIAEGAAASRARFAAEHATDRSAAATQSTIARDEARHAELGWRVLAWTIAQGGDDVADAVRDLRDMEVVPCVDRMLSPRDALALGRPEGADIARIHALHGRSARKRLETYLLPATPHVG
jgi:hypothetical protein